MTDTKILEERLRERSGVRSDGDARIMDEAADALSQARREREEMEAHSAYKTYWDGWNDCCDAYLGMSGWAAALRELKARARSAMSAPSSPSPAPGHTDLMVTPESIDAFMEANPLPASPREASVAVVTAFPHLARQFDLMAKGCRKLGLDSQEDDWDSRRQDANKGCVDPEVIVEAIDYDYRNGHDGRAAATLLVEALCKDLIALLAAAQHGASPREAELTEQLHYANGVADLAMKHRDIAEAALEEERERCDCHGLDNERQVFFYEQDFYVLSNFSAFKVQWCGLDFDTSEQAYHFQRFRPPFDQGTNDQRRLRGQIFQVRSAHKAFRLAQENKHLQRNDWDAVKINIMRDILRAKADQHEYVRRKLLATGDRELIENSWRDAFWGWGPNRDGKNMLGKLWMEIRAELTAAAIRAPKTGSGE